MLYSRSLLHSCACLFHRKARVVLRTQIHMILTENFVTKLWKYTVNDWQKCPNHDNSSILILLLFLHWNVQTNSLLFCNGSTIYNGIFDWIWIEYPWIYWMSNMNMSMGFCMVIWIPFLKPLYIIRLWDRDEAITFAWSITKSDCPRASASVHNFCLRTIVRLNIQHTILGSSEEVLPEDEHEINNSLLRSNKMYLARIHLITVYT